MAGLLQAPLVLGIETAGLRTEAVDGLVSLVAPLALGGVVGRLRDRSRAGAGPARRAARRAAERWRRKGSWRRGFAGWPSGSAPTLRAMRPSG